MVFCDVYLYNTVFVTTWNALQERFSCLADPAVMQDVYDGLEYQKHTSFLSVSTNVSLMLNTDGVKIFKSSNSLADQYIW